MKKGGGVTLSPAHTYVRTCVRKHERAAAALVLRSGALSLRGGRTMDYSRKTNNYL